MIYIVFGIMILLIITKIIRKQKRKKFVIYVVKENCTACKSCVKRCNHNVLEVMEDNQGNFMVIKNPQNCTACGNCIKKCKFNALKIKER